MEIAQAWTVCAEEAERKTRRASFGVNGLVSSIQARGGDRE
jgi:hypothetical protein